MKRLCCCVGAVSKISRRDASMIDFHQPQVEQRLGSLLPCAAAAGQTPRDPVCHERVASLLFELQYEFATWYLMQCTTMLRNL